MLDQIYTAPDEKRLLARFWQSASGFWRGRSAWRAWLLVTLLIATALLQLLTQYGLNFWNRDFFNAIGRKDAADLWIQALRFVPLAAVSLFLAILSVWARMTMQRTWREWLSNHLYDYWLENDHYVRLRFMAGDYQAPEFRIAEDARVATDLPIDLVLGLFSSLLTAITFIGVLWSVGDSLEINLGGWTITVPGYLVIAVIVYSILLSGATLLIARHLTRVLEENKRTEAELRSIGTHLRESGEGKTLPDGKKDGRHAVSAALKAVIAIWRIYCRQLMRLTLITYTSLLYPRHRAAAMYPEISGGNDDPRRGGPGGRGVRRRAGCVQLVHRQLCAPCGMGRFGEPRGVPAFGARSDRPWRRKYCRYLPKFRQCTLSDISLTWINVMRRPHAHPETWVIA
jgi:vitamin B12/bleomycin/antimicrobial peptide transport system ATP-binding/permease protein